MTVKTYSTKSNANRAAKALIAKLPEGFTVGEPKQYLEDWLFEVVSVHPEVSLTPEVREILEPFTVTYPKAPDQSAPLIEPASRSMKPYALWDFSNCDTPVAVAWEIYGTYYESGRIDERKAAIADAMAAGVQRNTAHTQYRRFRIKHGLPGAVGANKK